MTPLVFGFLIKIITGYSYEALGSHTIAANLVDDLADVNTTALNDGFDVSLITIYFCKILLDAK